jgi:hypothetical protein
MLGPETDEEMRSFILSVLYKILGIIKSRMRWVVTPRLEIQIVNMNINSDTC